MVSERGLCLLVLYLRVKLSIECLKLGGQLGLGGFKGLLLGLEGLTRLGASLDRYKFGVEGKVTRSGSGGTAVVRGVGH